TFFARTSPQSWLEENDVPWEQITGALVSIGGSKFLFVRGGPMFEDALMESGGKIKTKSKYFVIVGIIINFSIIAAMILIPLIYPEALPTASLPTLLGAP